MSEPKDAGTRSARHRPARSYRKLSQQILLLASRPTSWRAFLADIARILASFTACDELEIQVRRGRRRLAGWRYGRESDRLERLGSRQLDDDTALPDQGLETSPEEGGSCTRLVLRFGDDVWGWIDLRSRRPEFFHPTKRELYEDVALTLGASVAYHHAQFVQRERVKELSCLYQIAQVSADRDQPIDWLLSEIVAILPPAWQHSDVAEACIILDEHRFVTSGFDLVCTELEAPIVVAGRQRGRVLVGYTEERDTIDEGPFLDEEHSLLRAVARELGQIWERRQAAVEGQRLREQLRHADRLATIGQLAAGVAHELNEPLGSILGFAQLAAKTPELPQQVSSDLTRIAAAALHSREIVRKLNLFARQAPARREPMDLSRVVQDGLFLLEARCRAESIQLNLALRDDLPEVEGDSGQMTQVLMNLVVNAIQSMPDGGELRVQTHQTAQGVTLIVGDSGGGIPPEALARIFEPFFTTKDVGKGTGLGLSVVHGIVAAHGGNIQVESKPGAGTTFTVEIPVERADDPSES